MSKITYMNTYYCDMGWRGGVVVVAESEDKALELIKADNNIHSNDVTQVTLLKPNEVYTFYGDS